MPPHPSPELRISKRTQTSQKLSPAYKYRNARKNASFRCSFSFFHSNPLPRFCINSSHAPKLSLSLLKRSLLLSHHGAFHSFACSIAYLWALHSRYTASIRRETRNLNQKFPPMYQDWTSFLSEMPITLALYSSSSCTLFPSLGTRRICPKNTLLNTNSYITSTLPLSIILDVPDVVQETLQDTRNKMFKYCRYELYSDKPRLRVKKKDACGPTSSDWGAFKDFKAFKKVYYDSKPGFGFFRVNKNRVLSIMNFSHLGADPCQRVSDDFWQMSEPCQIHDADALQSLKETWVSIVGTIFNNVHQSAHV